MEEGEATSPDNPTPEEVVSKCQGIKLETTHQHYGLDTLAAAAAKDSTNLVINSNNKHTNRKTGADMKIFFNFLSSINENRQPQDIPAPQLDKLLCAFFMDVRKTDQTEYEPCSLRSMLASIERYLKLNLYPSSLTKDSVFAKTRYTLKVKQKLLRDMGKGAKSQHTFTIGSLKDKSLDRAFEAREMGPYTPSSIIQTLCFVFVVYLRLRKATEHKKLLWGDVMLDRDQNGREYITFSDQMLRRCTLQYLKQCQPVVYALPDSPERDPVRIYKLYASKRALNMNYPYAPFYLGMNIYNPNERQQWYKTIAMGINRLNDMVRIVRDLTGPAAVSLHGDDSLDAPQDLSLSATEKHSQRHNSDSSHTGCSQSDIVVVEKKSSAGQGKDGRDIKKEIVETKATVAVLEVEDSSNNAHDPLKQFNNNKNVTKPEPSIENAIDKVAESDDVSDIDDDVTQCYSQTSCDENEEDDQISDVCKTQPNDDVLSLATAKKQLEILVNKLKPSDVSDYNTWINNLDLIKDKQSGLLLCKEKETNKHVKSNTSVDDSEHHITLNITLSNKAFRGEKPVVVTASSRKADPVCSQTVTNNIERKSIAEATGELDVNKMSANRLINNRQHRRKRRFPTKQHSLLPKKSKLSASSIVKNS